MRRMQDHYRDITKEDFSRRNLETISVTNYPMVGKTVVTLSFSAYELGFYHFRMPVTMKSTIGKKVRAQELARKRIGNFEYGTE